ncbi:putative transcription factor MYB-HB-like family [Helianthus annuus]|nr:putative transcription factor MYB-HB-like family [Helianthus annuus]
MIDVNRASQNTLSNLKKSFNTGFSNGLFNGFKSFGKERANEMFIEGEETVDLTGDGSDLRKLRRVDSGNGGGGGGGGGGEEADSSARTSKRPRLVWTPQLNKRFVDVVAHLGVKNMVLKTIMQLMNVEGLTRENAASHLQKYRLYLKPMQGLSNEGPSSSDHLFASTPVPQSLQESSGNGNNVQIPMPYHLFESHSNPFNMMMHQRDWSGNKYAYEDRIINDK